jgi:hypothetical protein
MLFDLLKDTSVLKVNQILKEKIVNFIKFK